MPKPFAFGLIAAGLALAVLALFIDVGFLRFSAGSLLGGGLGSLIAEGVSTHKQRRQEGRLLTRLAALPDFALPILAHLLEKGILFADQIKVYQLADGPEALEVLTDAGFVNQVNRDNESHFYGLEGGFDRYQLKKLVVRELARREHRLTEPGPRLGPRSRHSGLAS